MKGAVKASKFVSVGEEEVLANDLKAATMKLRVLMTLNSQDLKFRVGHFQYRFMLKAPPRQVPKPEVKT
ncbi:hypothetical protein D5086_013015 [Populus alba]|uniref:Uncharacterized protein n=1 Tax=Populus alba TaxID=43335 RepID=A0ACC4C4I8_POPAL